APAKAGGAVTDRDDERHHGTFGTRRHQISPVTKRRLEPPSDDERPVRESSLLEEYANGSRSQSGRSATTLPSRTACPPFRKRIRRFVRLLRTLPVVVGNRTLIDHPS